MGNTIRINSSHENTDEWLSMSNGGTSVLISTLVLSGSRLAVTVREKEFVLWLAERDQSVCGIGTVGFPEYTLYTFNECNDFREWVEHIAAQYSAAKNL